MREIFLKPPSIDFAGVITASRRDLAQNRAPRVTRDKQVHPSRYQALRDSRLEDSCADVHTGAVQNRGSVGWQERPDA